MGLHQLETAEESRPVSHNSCSTRYKRLKFGVTSAPEMHRTPSKISCPGQKNLTDDIVVFAETVEEHDRRLEKVLRTFEQNGFTLSESR